MKRPTPDPPDAEREALGLAIRRFREVRGWSQIQLAAAVGTDNVTISRIELARTGISLKRLRAIAKALDLTTTDILQRALRIQSELRDVPPSDSAFAWLIESATLPPSGVNESPSNRRDYEEGRRSGVRWAVAEMREAIEDIARRGAEGRPFSQLPSELDIPESPGADITRKPEEEESTG